MQDNEELYKAWEAQAESKFEIVGDLSWFNSLIFHTSGEEKADSDFCQIGYDRDTDLFVYQINEGEEVVIEKTSQDAADLNKWLKEINAK